MPRVMLVCPQSGEHLDTGKTVPALTSGKPSLVNGRLFTAKCPHCGTTHTSRDSKAALAPDLPGSSR